MQFSLWIQLQRELPRHHRLVSHSARCTCSSCQPPFQGASINDPPGYTEGQIENNWVKWADMHLSKQNQNHDTPCESPEIWQEKIGLHFFLYVVLIMQQNIMEKELKSYTIVLLRADLTGPGHPTHFDRKGLDGLALLGQPSKRHPCRMIILFP